MRVQRVPALLLCSILLLAVMPAAAFGGGAWSDQSTVVSTALYSVDFIDANTGWAAGYNGTVLKTTDGGSSWTNMNWPPAVAIYKIQFIDANTGFITGENGFVYRSTDGGTTWSSIHSGGIYDTYGLHFLSSTSGWRVDTGGIRYYSGSTTWALQLSLASNLRDIYMVNSTTGWATGMGGLIYHTANGTSWAPQTSGTTNGLLAVYFHDANTGWAAGDGGTILKTTNGGTTWTPQTSGMSTRITDIEFVDANTGWACGWSGNILHTTDGGATWRSQYSGATENLAGLSPVSTSAAWISNSVNGTVRTYSPPPPSVEPVPAGSNVTISELPYGITVTFDTVTSAGSLTFTQQGSPAHPAPANFDLIDGTYYDITTTAAYTGNVTIVMPYDEGNILNAEDNLKLFHSEGGDWADVTISYDTNANTITGQTTSLSPFSGGSPTASSGSATGTPASSTWSVMLLAALGLFGIWRLRPSA